MKVLIMLFTIITLFFVNESSFASSDIQFKSCYKKAITTIEIRECIDKEYKFYSSRLQIAVNKLFKLLNHKSANEFRKAQKTWEKYKKDDCNFLGSRYIGGTLEPVTIGQCYIKKTKMRISEIRDYLHDFKEN